MSKMRIQNYHNIIYIYLNGTVSNNELEKIKINIRVMTRKYMIRKIQLEIDNNCNINFNDFEEFENILDYQYNNYFRQDNLYFRGLRA